MSRDSQVAVVVVGLIVVAVVVAGAIGAFRTTATTTMSGSSTSIPEPPSDGSAGVIFELRPGQTFSLFGIRLRSGTPVAHIGLVVPPECVVQDGSAGEVLLTEGVCADLPVHGMLSGGGTTASGHRLGIVRLEVPRTCFEVLAVGDPWPPEHDSCAGE